MREDQIDLIMTTFGVTRELAEDVLNNCGKDLEEIREYLQQKVRVKNKVHKCLCCGRPLSDPISISRGYGEECYKKIMNEVMVDLFNKNEG